MELVNFVTTLVSCFQIGEKIPFAVTPNDPRYYLPESVIKNGLEGLYEGRPHPGMNGDPEGSRKPSRSELLEELYYQYGHLAPGSNGDPSEKGFYRGHKFGPLPPSFEGKLLLVKE